MSLVMKAGIRLTCSGTVTLIVQNPNSDLAIVEPSRNYNQNLMTGQRPSHSNQ